MGPHRYLTGSIDPVREVAMARRYCAFLVRCWRVGDGAQRIEIEQVQSGEKALVASLDAAVAWMGERIGGAPAEPPAAAERAGRDSASQR